MGAVLRNAVCYFRKIPRWWEECNAMAVGLVGSNYTRGAANTVVEKRSEIIDAIATEASPFDGGPPTKVDQRFSPISASTPRPLPRPLPPSFPPLFFPKDNPRWPPFCLLSEIACSEIDRRLRPTDVCSAATALTLRHRKNIIGFSILIFFSSPSF